MTLIGDARTIALRGLIDYAGLFPPASLDMEGAVAGYRAARGSDAAWIAGRFLCPTSRLEDLAAILTKTMASGEQPWGVGAIFDDDVGTAASHAATFHMYTQPAATVQVAEIRLPGGAGKTDVESVFVAAGSVDADIVMFLEVPRTEAWEAEIPAVVGHIADVRSERRRDLGAKLRCGGLEPEAFPSPEQVACFIIACEQRGLPFKATAGLHHPIRHHDADLGVMRHGFLNLLLASAVAAENVPFHDVAAVVADTEPDAFAVSAGAMTYRDHSFPTRSIAAIRTTGFTAYGSCDFDEPVQDLRTMGVLG